MIISREEQLLNFIAESESSELQTPKSRNEEILQAIIKGTDISQLGTPKSREEELLTKVAEIIASGGGGGSGGTNILSGTSDPSSEQGSNGDIYLKYNEYSELPENDYTPLKYIETGDTAGAYIDTGVGNSATSYYEIKAQYTAIPGNNYGIFGAQAVNEFTYNTWQSTTFAKAGLTNGGVVIADPLNVHTIRADANGVSLDDGIKTGTAYWNNYTGRNYYLFAINYSGGILSSPNARIYYCKLWSDGSLVRCFVPAKRKSDDLVGMYDTVNGVFYTNNGTQEFIAGEVAISDISHAYAKINGSWANLIGSNVNDIIEGR